ncbi:MAG: hypothetical protein Q9218_006090 [Villophora microphyllina]
MSEPLLSFKLAAALPAPHRFRIHHLSTPPIPSPAIYSAPPGQKPEKTNCESHFLSVSILHSPSPSNGPHAQKQDQKQEQIQILALEIIIYTTATLTTIFVSKADSTGYIHLLKIPKGTPSPLRTITSIFLSHLVELHQRKDRQLVVSLFARAQDQYLFPGSIENAGKHVLDDRGLIKWWCRVLEPVLHNGNTSDNENIKSTAKAYLRVPGCDLHEHLSFFPPSVRRSPNLRAQWYPSRDPLLLLNRPNNAPERCLIPRFPDDPKSRFVDELDEELTEPPPDPKKQKESPSKGKRPGKWRSVRSLEEFWETMAFRQECSSGRLVGFLWAVFTPDTLPSTSPPKLDFLAPKGKTLLPRPEGSQTAIPLHVPSSPAIDEIAPSASAPPLPPPSHSPPQKKKEPHSSTTGAVTLPQKHYTRCITLLLHLDYANLAIATESSERWISDVGICANNADWGYQIVGQRKLESDINRGEDEPVEGQKTDRKTLDEKVKRGVLTGPNVLVAGIVRKKKRAMDGEGSLTGEPCQTVPSPQVDALHPEEGVNVLSTGLVRKKPKVK